MEKPKYLHLKLSDVPPSMEGSVPFKAVVVIDADITPEWRDHVSDWLVRSGCRYMMAWGRDCGAWDSSVDEANLQLFDYGEIPEDSLVMTTWHDNEPLGEVFWFSQFCAAHPSLELQNTYIVHVAPEPREREMLQAYGDASAKDG